jgi:hypothetical protein
MFFYFLEKRTIFIFFSQVIQVIDAAKCSEIDRFGESFSIGAERRLKVANKIDLLPNRKDLPNGDFVFVSLKTGEGSFRYC